MQKKLALFFALCCIILTANASNIDTAFFRQQERMLLLVHSQIGIAEPSQKKQCELAFRDSLIKTLQYADASLFPFDSLKILGRIISKDKNLILYTWNIPQQGGFNNYYGIAQYLIKKEKKFTTTILEEKIGFLNTDEQAPAFPTNWPGALYYYIVTNKEKGETYYTLFGFDFNNLISNRKTIEVIKFDEMGTLHFQPQAFLYEGKRKNRIVFEYAERVQMLLNYNEKEKIIYFDHLSPFKPSLQGQYQFYGPDLSYDGFKFEDGIWLHQSDIRPEF